MGFAEKKQDGGGLIHDASVAEDQGRHPRMRVELQIGGRFLFALIGINLDKFVGRADFDQRCMAGHVGAALTPVERVH